MSFSSFSASFVEVWTLLTCAKGLGCDRFGSCVEFVAPRGGASLILPFWSDFFLRRTRPQCSSMVMGFRYLNELVKSWFTELTSSKDRVRV